MSKALFTINSYTQEERDQFESALLNYEKKNSATQLKVGHKLSGAILSISEKEAKIFAFGKSDVIIPMTPREKRFLEHANVGDHAAFIVNQIVDDKSGFIIYGSVAENYAKEVQNYLQLVIDNDIVLKGTPISMNHAGYDVKIDINGDETLFFMPHLVTSVNKLSNPESILNIEMEVMLECFTKENQKNYIASHKKYLETLVPTAMSELTHGQGLKGVVTGFREFGVFVQFNTCLTGMIHKSNLDEETLKILTDGTIKSGDEIIFYVKDIVKNNIFLTQVLRESLWDNVEIGQELTGEISAIKDFGVMVQLDYETRGLLHTSVLVNDIDQYRKGDQIDVVVTNVNKSKRQITLNQR